MAPEPPACTPPVQMDTVLDLLTEPGSTILAARHIASLEALGRKNTGGFYMADLGQVCSIMDITIKVIKRGESHFVNPLCLVLR
jgi:hypothetical protein